MRKHEIRNQILTVALVAVLTSVPSLSAGQSQDNSSTKTQTTDTNAAKASSSGPHEGIKVHGHWSVVIKNPDGSVASHHEFENSLVNTGPDLLAQLLARAATPGAWEINLLNSQAGGSACGGVGCSIFESGINVAGPNPNNLTVTYAANPARAQLQGSFQASSAGDIAQVQTLYYVCAPSVTSSACPASLSALSLLGVQPFTARTLPAPIAVQSGQIVQVSVTFTFS